jgi:glyoxylase-like metal-dependent hydrolase (beta-lactamase superfamily II)
VEIAPGVHHLKQDLAPVFAGSWTVVSVVEGERLAVIDTGMPETVQAVLLPYLAKIGRSPADVGVIALTHAHGDHFCGNEELKRLSGAPIFAHELEADALEEPLHWLDREITPGPADCGLRDGDVLDLGGRSLEVVHLPGHTPGSCGYYLRDSATLITGDALQALGTTAQSLPFYADPDAYVATVRKALALRVEHLVLAHAYLPFTESHLHGDEVRRFLEVSLEFALGFDDQLIADLPEPASADELTERACRRLGIGGPTEMAKVTVRAHLTRLAAKGRLRVGGVTPTYSLA